MCQIVKTRIKEIIKQPHFVRNFICTYLAYLIGYAAIFQANCLYKTDWSRASGFQGEFTNWRHSGRIINDILTYLFNFSAVPQDISPLTQLLAMVFLTLTSVILTQVICHKITYRALLVSVVVGLCPYYLQVFSYVFDSVYYSLATLIAVIPFLFYRDNRAFYISSVVCLLWCLMSFQATISIYMIVVAYLFYRDYQENKVSVLHLSAKMGITMLLFILTGVLYYAAVHLIYSGNSPALFQSEICKLSECGDLFVKNVKRATAGYFYRHWKNTALGWAFVSIFAAFIVFQIKQGWISRRKAGKIVNVVAAVIVPFVLLAFIGLWTMFFTFIYWNARIWVGTGVCLAIMLLAMRNETNKYLRRTFYTLSVIMVWGCVVFANRVGNLLDAQNKYVDFKIMTVSQDLSNTQVKGIKFMPNTIHSPVVLVRAKEYPILTDLVAGIQHKWRRFTDYYFGFYRPDLHWCSSQRVDYRQVIVDNPHHKMTQINDGCIEIEMR